MKAVVANRKWPYVWLLSFIMLILLLPVVATFMYAVAVDWGISLLPKGWTLEWLAQLWQDRRFLLALRNSLLICLAAAVVTILVSFPIVFLVHTRWQRHAQWVNVLVTLPFAVPPVVSAVGMLQLYAQGPLAMTGTPWMLIGCYFTIALPFVYRALDNNFRALQVNELLAAAYLMGASTRQAVWYVILPNLKKGLLIALFVSLSFLMGEFVFANLLASSQFETLQVYLYSIKNMSGHYSSALVASYFTIILIMTFCLSLIDNKAVGD
ncbi:MAG: ABC transporter permease subunit [Neisseriaceae bacterium]|nr:ABC transporter permease subunit [Neisseriaceae bacterium]